MEVGSIQQLPQISHQPIYSCQLLLALRPRGKISEVCTLSIASLVLQEDPLKLLKAESDSGELLDVVYDDDDDDLR